MTIAAPWLASLPEARDREMAPSRAFCASAWIWAFMLVTRSSPAWAGVVPSVPVTFPAAFTVTTSVPGVPRSWLSYCCSRPAWPTSSTPEKPVTARWRLAISAGVIGCVYPSTCAGLAPSGCGDSRVQLLLLQHLQRDLCRHALVDRDRLVGRARPAGLLDAPGAQPGLVG